MLAAVWVVLFVAVGGVCAWYIAPNVWSWITTAMMGGRSIPAVMAQYGDAARARLQPHFDVAGVAYPPAGIALLGFKEEKQLELYAKDAAGQWRFIRRYPIVAASGIVGPKLREGDLQVPEGIYAIETLNPNSSFHLSLRVNYPNAFDRAIAEKEARTNLGGDIYIHGKDQSVGCLAMGDAAIEELFVLVVEVGKENIEVILAPEDFRIQGVRQGDGWRGELYAAIAARLRAFSLGE